MKQTLTIVLLMLIGVVFQGCDSDNTTGGEGNASQIMFIYAEHHNYYWDEETDEKIYTENITAGGVILSDQIPEFIYLKLGKTVFKGDNCYEIFPGYVSFGSFVYGNTTRITSNFNPLNVEVKTSFGKLEGRISLPDIITTLTLSEYDTLQIGESFTISWSGNNADFYFVYCGYKWEDSSGIRHYEDLDEFVSGNSITYPGSIFTHDGEIYFIGVQPINGPFPEEGAAGNMVGVGTGFLYYLQNIFDYKGSDIIIGSGLNDGIARTSSNKPNEAEIQELIRKQIEKRILGNKSIMQ